jgi:hypothetical protein
MHHEVSAFRDVYQAMYRYLPFPTILGGPGELLDICHGVFEVTNWPPSSSAIGSSKVDHGIYANSRRQPA